MDNNSSNRDWQQEFVIRPVGFVSSELKDPSLKSGSDGLSQTENQQEIKRQSETIKRLVSRIDLNPALSGILDGLEQFSHALVLYWPHLGKPESREILRVHPMGNTEINKVGVYASCSPARPNPILVTAVTIVEVNQNSLRVQGLEAVDGSPVLDIKPYNRHYLEVKDLKTADWMSRIEEEMSSSQPKP